MQVVALILSAVIMMPGISSASEKGRRIYREISNLVESNRSDDLDQMLNKMDSNAVRRMLTFYNPNTGTFLERAAEINHDKIAEVLIRYGADPDLADEDGMFPLQIATWRHSLATAKVLLEHGANVNKVFPSNGATVLMDAVMTKDVGYVKMLLDHSANPNQQDLQGNNALHHALRFNNETWWAKDNGPVVELLIGRDAEIDHENRDGKTPLYVAVEKNVFPVALVLMRHGADPDYSSDCSDAQTPRQLNHDMIQKIEIEK